VTFQGPTGSPFLALRRRLSKSPTYTWCATSWAAESPGTGPMGTEFQLIPIPDDFYAVRVGFLRLSSAYPVTRVKVCPSLTANNYYTPLNQGGTWTTADAPWTTLTFLHNGADVDDLVTAAGAPASATIPANTIDRSTGEAGIPGIYWSDWKYCPFDLVGGTTTGMRFLMVRTLGPTTNTTFTFATGRMGSHNNGPGSGWSGDPANNSGYDYFFGGLKLHDKVTEPSDPISLARIQGNSASNGPIAAIVQARCRNAVTTLGTCGTSVLEGTSTATQHSNFALRAATQIGAANLDVRPYGSVNFARGGATSQIMFARAKALLASVPVSVLVIQSHNANEVDPARACFEANMNACNLQFARLLDFLGWLQKQQPHILPVILTPIPASPRSFRQSNGEGVSAWLRLYHQVMSMGQQGYLVWDVSTPFSATRAGTMTGVWDGSAYSDDELHPNDTWHQWVADNLVKPLMMQLEGTG
jgi:hypothetical protein